MDKRKEPPLPPIKEQWITTPPEKPILADHLGNCVIAGTRRNKNGNIQVQKRV